MTREYSSTSVESTLNSGINTTATTMTVPSTAAATALLAGVGLAAGNVDIFTVAIDVDTINEEIVYITGVSGDTFTISRGQAGTGTAGVSGITHSAGASVKHVLTSSDLILFRNSSSPVSSFGFSGSTSGTTTVQASAVAGTNTLTLPATNNDTLVGKATTDVLTNKTLTAPVISTITNTGTLTLPTSTDTIVGRATTDTLTNKTLTSPVLTTPSISNINAKGDLLPGTADNTIGTLTVGANGTVLTADSAEATGMKWATTSGGGTYTDYTPTFTNFTLGNGTINVARYIQNGKQVSGYIKVTLGSTSSMGTNPIFTLPVTASSNMQASATIGSANIDDAGAAAYEGIVKYSTTTTARLTVANASATYVQTSVIQSTVPMTWVSTDSFTLDFTYEAA
jgi:hypothetical protein